MGIEHRVRSNERCVAGRCECNPGLTTCGTSACVDLRRSAQNCGQCGTACPGQVPFCVDGICRRCDEGMDDCGFGCISLRSNPAHCGACYRRCATGDCQDGLCRCPAGETNCSGWCVDLQTSRENCGACGNQCAVVRPSDAGVTPITEGAVCLAGRCQCEGPGLRFCPGRATVDGGIDRPDVVSGVDASVPMIVRGGAPPSRSTGSRPFRFGAAVIVRAASGT